MRLVAVESPDRVRVRDPRRGMRPRCPAVGGPLGVAIIFWVVLQEESALSLSFTWAFGDWMPKKARQTTQMSEQASKSGPNFCKTVQKIRSASQQPPQRDVAIARDRVRSVEMVPTQ